MGIITHRAPQSVSTGPGGRLGFTLMEMIVVIAVIALLAAVSLINLIGSRSRTNLDSSTRKISALLREAQSRSVVQESGVSWGVHFENATTLRPFYALFYNSYSASTVVERYPLPTLVDYATSSLGVGSSTEIAFAQISGLPFASTSITLVLSVGGRAVASSVIRVSSSGLVGY